MEAFRLRERFVQRPRGLSLGQGVVGREHRLTGTWPLPEGAGGRQAVEKWSAVVWGAASKGAPGGTSTRQTRTGLCAPSWARLFGDSLCGEGPSLFRGPCLRHLGGCRLSGRRGDQSVPRGAGESGSTGVRTLQREGPWGGLLGSVHTPQHPEGRSSWGSWQDTPSWGCSCVENLRARSASWKGVLGGLQMGSRGVVQPDLTGAAASMLDPTGPGSEGTDAPVHSGQGPPGIVGHAWGAGQAGCCRDRPGSGIFPRGWHSGKGPHAYG